VYRKHFGLARHPFAKDLAVEDLFASTAVTELEVRLRHLLDLRGIGLVTGEPGGGKTTICRKVVASLHSGLFRVFYVPLSTGNVMDIYKSIAWELGLPTERSRAALYRVIRAEVTRLCLETKVRPILIVDDAQYLRSDVLEELRLLTNYEMDSQNRLCLLLVGQAELRRRISMAVRAGPASRSGSRGRPSSRRCAMPPGSPAAAPACPRRCSRDCPRSPGCARSCAASSRPWTSGRSRSCRQHRAQRPRPLTALGASLSLRSHQDRPPHRADREAVTSGR